MSEEIANLILTTGTTIATTLFSYWMGWFQQKQVVNLLRDELDRIQRDTQGIERRVYEYLRKE